MSVTPPPHSSRDNDDGADLFAFARWRRILCAATPASGTFSNGSLPHFDSCSAFCSL
ncbi:hypothetical protein MY11210_003470 [Beauveria gryllotalpidicola]